MKNYLIILLFSFVLILPAHAQEVLVNVNSEIGLIVSSTLDSATTTTTKTVSSTNIIIYDVKTDRELVEEPLIRVGLFATKDIVRFNPKIGYEIYTGDEIVGLLSEGEITKLSYIKGRYFLISDNLNLESDKFWRFVPTEANGVFELPGCKRTLTGRKQFYCTYRGTLEYRYGQKSKMPYLINELLLEDYMKGITETDNNSAEGYIKAVLVAARSYAYKNISFSPPTEKRLFDVYSTTQDQLYLGYSSEKEMPRVARFAQETAGEMVTYKGGVVTTPYFTHTNGATKDWKNYAGKKDRPWLVSVKCIYDKYKKMYGHGVGMSTHDALVRATKDDWVYVQLLKYYYSGTEVERIY